MNKFLFSDPVIWLDEAAAGGGDPAKPKDPPPDAGGNGGKQYTQEELDRMFAERATRAQEAEKKRILETLGVKDEDELKVIIEARKKADEEAKTELEKLADQARTASEKAEKLEAESAVKLAEMQKRLMDSEIKIAASRAIADKDGKVTRAAFRAEALDDILLLADRSLITETDGKYEGVEKALETLAKTKPYLLAEATPQTTSKGTPKSPVTPKPAGNGKQEEYVPIIKSL